MRFHVFAPTLQLAELASRELRLPAGNVHLMSQTEKHSRGYSRNADDLYIWVEAFRFTRSDRDAEEWQRVKHTLESSGVPFMEYRLK